MPAAPPFWRGFAFAEAQVNITPQRSSAVLEADCPLTERERERILAEMQAIGVRAVILPMGVTLAAMTECDMDGDDDE